MNGMGKEYKRKWVKDLVTEHKVCFLCIQETKAVIDHEWQARSIWGRNDVNFAALDSMGIPLVL